jgi:putative transcriptional regulator
MLRVTMIRIHFSRLLGERKLKMAEVSRLTGLSKNALSDLYYEKTLSMRFDTLSKLCQVLNCQVGDLLEYIPDEANAPENAQPAKH